MWDLDEYDASRKLKPTSGGSEEKTICLMDGVHPTHNVQPTYGWIKKGERKEIPANSVGEPGLIFLALSM